MGDRTPHKSHDARLRRELQAFELRAQGLKMDKIGEIMGCSDRTVSNLLRSGFERRTSPVREEARQLEDEKLDIREREWFRLFLRDTADGEDKERADRGLARVAERRARLHGLDAPTKIDIMEHMSYDLIDAFLAQERARLQADEALALGSGDDGTGRASQHPVALPRKTGGMGNGEGPAALD